MNPLGRSEQLSWAAMTEGFPLQPRDVPAVDTIYRKIVTPIPVPESVPVIEALRRHEPKSMSGQPLVVWDRADGFAVHDRWGNQWLDFTSGVLVTNAGHGHPKVKQAILDQTNQGLLHNYCFPSEIRSRLPQPLVLLDVPACEGQATVEEQPLRGVWV